MACINNKTIEELKDNKDFKKDLKKVVDHIVVDVGGCKPNGDTFKKFFKAVGKKSVGNYNKHFKIIGGGFVKAKVHKDIRVKAKQTLHLISDDNKLCEISGNTNADLYKLLNVSYELNV